MKKYILIMSISFACLTLPQYSYATLVDCKLHDGTYLGLIQSPTASPYEFNNACYDALKTSPKALNHLRSNNIKIDSETARHCFVGNRLLVPGSNGV